MTFASSSGARAARTLRHRSIPLVTASALSLTLYSVHSFIYQPLHADSAAASTSDSPEIDSLSTSVKKQRTAIAAAASPYTPLGWGNNRYLTLVNDPAAQVVKRPTPLPQLGSTPLRDLVVAEKYGAAIDARGDIWMWGMGYDQSGEIGRSLRGKSLSALAPAPGKLVALSKSGRLYAVSASRAFQDHRLDKRDQSWWSYLFGSDAGADHVELRAEGGLKRGEHFTDLSTGRHHLLAVTNKGRTFSLPLSPAGNSHRQLGTRQIFDLPDGDNPSSAIPLSPDLPPESDPRFCTRLTEIPSLAGIAIAQVAASDRTSFVRTPTGRVLGFGANEAGQIGLGSNAVVDAVTVPVEVVLAKIYPGGTQVVCQDVKAGGNSTFFVVERETLGGEGKGVFVDLLACGNGLSGSLGNGLWSSASGNPVRVKTVSGLREYSEKAKAFMPLGIHAVSVAPSPSAHVFATLDTVSQADVKGVQEGRYGKDVMVWGGNADYQLGNGKRSSLAIPQHLPPLVPKAIDALDPTPRQETSLSSGTVSPMPHSRLQLHQTKTNAFDPLGKLIKRGVRCEETVVAGWNCSVLYNKIID